MSKMMIIAVAVATCGLAACANTANTAHNMDQAPYAYDRTVGTAPQAMHAPARHSDTVFHAKQVK